MRRKIAVALALLVPTLTAAPAAAETFHVTTEDDHNQCNQSTCSLRAAFMAAEANGNDEDDLIVVPAGDYNLAELGLTLTAARNITVRGAGADATTIRADEDGGFRTLTLTNFSQATLEDLTLRDGRAPGPLGGGNVLVQGGSDLTLRRVRVTGGQAPNGGGIHVQGGGNGSVLTIAQSLIDNNTATGSAGSGLGGGIYIEGQTSSAVVTISDSTITGNEAATGGAIGVTANSANDPELYGVTARATPRATPAGSAGSSRPSGCASRARSSPTTGP
jgi:hypothetical protein